MGRKVGDGELGEFGLCDWPTNLIKAYFWLLMTKNQLPTAVTDQEALG